MSFNYGPPKKEKFVIKNTHLKLLKIVTKLDYHEYCSICHKPLKKALITNEGIMGYDCYLKQIGIIVKKQNITIKDIPAEAFEDIAVQFTKDIENIDPERLAELSISRQMSYRGYRDQKIELEYPIRYVNSLRFRYYPKKEKYGGDKGWIDDSLLTNLTDVGDLLGYHSDIIHKLGKTKALNQWWYKQIQLYQLNPDGLPKEEFIQTRNSINNM